MRRLILAAAFLPAVAFAQPAPKPAATAMVILPAPTVNSLMDQMRAIVTLRPELETPALVQAFHETDVCIRDNPVNGILVRRGPDQCPPVTAALAAQAKALADAQKAAAPAKPGKPVPAKH